MDGMKIRFKGKRSQSSTGGKDAKIEKGREVKSRLSERVGEV